jgi:chromosome segregation ATPase
MTADRTIESPSHVAESDRVAEIRAHQMAALDVLSQQAEQLANLEADVEAHLHDLIEELSRHESNHDVLASELSEKQKQLAAEAAELATAREQLQREREAWKATVLQSEQSSLVSVQQREQELCEREKSLLATLQQNKQELEDRECTLTLAETRCRQSQREVEAIREDLIAEREQVARLRRRLEDQERQLDTEQADVARLKSETRAQRQRLAAELRQRHAEQLSELARQKGDLESTRREVEQARHREDTTSQREIEQFRTTVAAREVEVTGLQAELTSAKTELENLRKQTEILGFEHERLAQELAVQSGSEAPWQRQLLDLQLERDELVAEVARLKAEPPKSDSSEIVSQLQRRLELANEDIRDLKRRNADMEQGRAVPGPIVHDGAMDWESQKRRLLASLEADDVDDGSGASRKQRMQMEEVIRATDQAIARKDEEIMELRSLLHSQSDNLGNVAVGASAIAAMFDQDELIQSERVKLEQLQTEWREKLRAAELEISLERAKVARDRAGLEDQLLGLQSEQAKRPKAPATIPSEPPIPGRKWLSRLGIKE